MKLQTIIYMTLALGLLNACQKKETSHTESPAATVEQTAATSNKEPENTITDAVTAATARPNTVSFNGVIVSAPQSEATIAVTMGGIVRQANLVPGQFVQKGSLIATLKNPDFITLQQNYLEALAQVNRKRGV